MTDETASKVFSADIANLAEYARGLGDRIASAPDRFLKLVIAVTMLSFTLVKLTGDANHGDMEKVLDQYGVALSIIYGLVALIGVLLIFELVRSRYHYIAIIRYNNILRSDAFRVLQLNTLGHHIWTDHDIRLWPWDSASTFAFAAVVVVTATITWLSVYASTKSCLWASSGGALVIGISVAASWHVNKKLA